MAIRAENYFYSSTSRHYPARLIHDFHEPQKNVHFIRYEEDSVWDKYDRMIDEIEAKLLPRINHEGEKTQIEIGGVCAVARDVLAHLKEVEVRPLFITPTADLGVIIRHNKDKIRHVFEIHSTGNVIYLTGERGKFGDAREIQICEVRDIASKI